LRAILHSIVNVCIYWDSSYNNGAIDRICNSEMNGASLFLAGNLDAVFHRTALALHCNARLDTLASVAF
jgi:hypothetical protein